MKHLRVNPGSLLLSLAILLGAGATSECQAVTHAAEIVIQDVFGTASYMADGTWLPLSKDMKLSQGALIKTEADSTVDLVLNSSLTAMRLTPNSSLRVDRLRKEAGFDMWVTDTVLTLLSGSVAGTQSKLAAPSRFQINVAGGVATIVGTDYYVRADGAVTVTSGEVSLNYNMPGSGGSVQVTVAAGYSFDPATGQVVATTPAYLENIIAHISTTKQNAQVFKVGRATLVVKPERYISPH